MLNSVRELLEQQGHNEGVKTLSDMEATWRIRIITGAPPQSGPTDVDGVGIPDWAPAVYCEGVTPARGLQLIYDTLKCKERKGHALPTLKVHFQGVAGFQIPEPWLVCGRAEASVPGPFSVLPPKGKRHILAQLEVQPPDENPEDEEAEAEENQTEPPQNKYVLSFFGGVWSFKDLFDEHRILGSSVVKEGTERREYVRILDGLSINDQQSETRIRTVLEDVLRGIPIFLINNTEPVNEMATYLLSFDSVVHGEDVEV